MASPKGDEKAEKKKKKTEKNAVLVFHNNITVRYFTQIYQNPSSNI